MTSKLKVGASNDSFQSALMMKDDNETISIDEETISMEDDEAELGAVGGIAKNISKPWIFVWY